MDRSEQIEKVAKKNAGKEPNLCTTRSIEISIREVWEVNRDTFIAGAKWADSTSCKRGRKACDLEIDNLNQKLSYAKDALNELHDHNDPSIQYINCIACNVIEKLTK